MVFKTIIFTILAAVVFARSLRLNLENPLEEQCRKRGAEDQIAVIHSAVNNLSECFTNLFNTAATALQIRRTQADDVSVYDFVKLMCERGPQLKTSYFTVLDSMTPCVDEAGRDHITFTKNADNQLLEFLCFNDGVRIASNFTDIIECLYNNNREILECGTGIQTAHDIFKSDFTTAVVCSKYAEAEACVIPKLHTCKPSAINMYQTLFRINYNSYSCSSINSH